MLNFTTRPWALPPGREPRRWQPEFTAAFKAVRDALAGVVGIDDGSDAYSFEYDQEKSPKIGFRIEMEW